MRRMRNDELEYMCVSVMQVVQPLRSMRHVKSGGHYLIRGTALQEHDLQVVVLYSPEDAPNAVFTRPYLEVLSRFVPVYNGGVWPTSST